jgi:uncharacterized membrane protein
MPEPVLVTLTLLAAIGAGIIAGVFFAFSTFIMRALAQLAPDRGMEAMQTINIVVINPLFLVPFMGTALLCLAVAIGAILDWNGAALLRLVGSAAYVLGVFAITMARNVPLNNALAAATPDEAGQSLWAAYLRRWTRWNHVRTVAAIAAMVCLILALRP